MIGAWLRQLPNPPLFPDEEQTRHGRILNTILWASCASVLLFVVIIHFIFPAATPVLVVALVAFLLFVGNLILLKKGHLHVASWLFSLSTWLLLAVLAIYASGIQSDAYKAQFIAILIAGILLGWRVGFLFVFLSLGWGILLIVGTRQQLLPSPILVSPTLISEWLSAAVMFLLTAVWLHIATNNTRHALTKLRHSNQQLQARTRELEAVRQIGLELAATLELDSLLTSTMKTAAELLNGERGGLFLYQVNEQVLELVAHYDFEATPVGTKLQIGQGLAGKVWQLGSPLVVENYREWPGSIPELVPIIKDRSVIGITLQRGDEKLGVLTLTAKDGHVYTQRDVELLSLFTSGAAVAIQNARLHQQQQQAEIALRESEATARVLLNAPPDVMLLLDKSGVILDLNETAAKSLGQPVSPQMNQVSMHDIFTGEVANVRLQALEKVFATGKAVYFEDERNGRWFDNSVYPIFDTQGQVARIAVYARNISAQKAAQAERESLIADLEAKNEELERFTYTVSHDLKSPLVTIMGFLGFVEKDAATGNLERLAEDIAKIRGAAEKMKRLLNDLLELSRIGRLINPPVAVSFSEIVQEALAVVSGQIAARGVQVTVADNLPIVKADRVRLMEVVQNLVDNAVRFMGDQPAPHIQIGVRPDGQTGQSVFFVQDNGIGIASQYHENIFGLFNRLNPNTAGTGIGLALVKRIIETHGGQIWVESAVGQGSTFCFTLGV